MNQTGSHDTLARWRQEWTGRQWLALAVPPLLTATMFLTFRQGVAWFGHPAGYLFAFLVYWVVWCLLLPAILLEGWRNVLGLFDPTKARPAPSGVSWKTTLLLLWPLLFPLFFRFLPQLSELNTPVLVISIVLGLAIGVTEEILWRGVYIRLFPGSVSLNTIYPSIMFALWHIAPQSVHANPSPGGVASFVFYALILGLSYATHARKSGSIRGCTVSHCLHDILGLGGFAYAAWLL